MDPAVEAVEHQFLTLNNQIQRERNLCNNIEIELAKIRNDTKNNEEKIELKNSLAKYATSGVRCSENNYESLQSSLETTTMLINELKQLTDSKNDESRDLAKTLQKHERNWISVEETYKCLPVANEVNTLENLKKKSVFEKMLKLKEITETKSKISLFRDIKEKHTKSLIVKLAHFSLKQREQYKKNLQLKEKIGCLTSEVDKLRQEKCSLIGNMQNILTPNIPYIQPKGEDGFVAPPPYGMLGRKHKLMNMNPKFLHSPSDVSTYKLPQLKVPAFGSSSCNIYVEGKYKESTVNKDQCAGFSMIRNNKPASLLEETCEKKRKKTIGESCSSSVSTSKTIIKDGFHSQSRQQEYPTEEKINIISHPNYDKFKEAVKRSSNYISCNTNNSNEKGLLPLPSTSEKPAPKEITVVKGFETSEKCKIQNESSFTNNGLNNLDGVNNYGSGNFQYLFVNPKMDDNTLTFNFDSSSKQNNNVWDII